MRIELLMQPRCNTTLTPISPIYGILDVLIASGLLEGNGAVTLTLFHCALSLKYVWVSGKLP